MALSQGMVDYLYEIGEEDGLSRTKYTKAQISRRINLLIGNEEFDYDRMMLTPADSAEAYEYYLNAYLIGELKTPQEEEVIPREYLFFIEPKKYVKLPKQASIDEHENGLYWMVDNSLPDFEKKIEKLNKRGARMELPPITYDLVRYEFAPVSESDNQYEARATDFVVGQMKFAVVAVEGEAPKYAGWVFQAVVQPIAGTNKAILMNAPDVELPAKIREKVSRDPFRCDHCKKARKRNATYIVKHEDRDEYMQVGQSCIKDFTGHKSPQDIANYYKALHTLMGLLTDKEEREESAKQAPIVVSIEDFFAELVHDWKKNGYKKGLGSQTFMFSFADKKAKRVATKKDEAQAKEALSIILNLVNSRSENQLSSYEYNVKTVLESGAVEHKTANIAGSAILMYQRQLEQETKAAKGSESEWIGNVGQRLDFGIVDCKRTRWVESAFGTSQLCIFEDESGNELKWFNGGRSEVEQGTRYKLTGTVKKHETYQGKKSTMLTRCKVSPV